MFCSNCQCEKKTFSEFHPFVENNGKKTRRLVQNILFTSAQLSSVNGKMFCSNCQCEKKTFSEFHPFVENNGKKTRRLVQNILFTSAQLSSVNAEKILKSNSIEVGKSSIYSLLKKNAINCG